MNGNQIVAFPLDGPDWDAMVAKSKFADWPVFGKSPKGHIGLQDHGDQVSYRNIKIKHLIDLKGSLSLIPAHRGPTNFCCYGS